MSELAGRLERLGLSQYLDVLVAEGFDTWETVLDITESDLNSLNVKLGHRRKLQRAIADSRGQSAARPLPIALGKTVKAEPSYKSDDSATENKTRPVEPAAAPAGTSTKRKYRRHPKPDEHAPERPPSAYVIFSNQVRETLKGQDLSFTDIAKVVGERWQVLEADAREACERQANAAKEKYYAELAEYKKTPQYEAYQKYLEEFKAKHAAQQKAVEGKRSKLETETSTSTRSSSHEQGDLSSRRISLVQPDAPGLSNHIPDSIIAAAPARLPSAPLYPSKSASPATHNLSNLNSPRTIDQYSPLSASPRSVSLHKENSYELQPSARPRDSRGSDSSIPFAPSVFPQSYRPASMSPSNSYSPHYQTAPVDLPSRRSYREPSKLPSLTHEDTTISSDGGSHAGSYPPPTLPPLVDQQQKTLRTLPKPVPTMGPASSPLDRPITAASGPQQHPDYRNAPSMALLLRAGELARGAGNEDDMEKGMPP